MDNLLLDIFPIMPNSETNSFIRKSLERAYNRLPIVSSSGCLPYDVGLFLSHSVQVLDVLADSLVEGKHMRANTRLAIQQLENENDLSEIEPLDGLIETHAILRKIGKRIHSATIEIQNLWDEVPAPPVLNSSAVDVDIGSGSNNEAAVSAPIYEYPAEENPFSGMSAEAPEIIPYYDMSGQPQDSDAAPDLMPSSSDIKHGSSGGSLDQLLDNLELRGSGTYTCPFGSDCRKGAVGDDGALVVFTRNSQFRAHVEKHMKRYKCSMPNCPTRKGFSRRDQLRRHQEHVPHIPQ